jgi:ABC-2 type transport system ATP-binding protein
MIGGLRGQCTVFMSTHILQDVERVCDTIGIIDRGKLIVEAPRAELVERFSAPAFELECDEGSEEALAAWLEGLRRLPWVRSTDVNGTVARVTVDEMDVSRHKLLSEAVAAGLALRRFEIVTPSLEDIFLRLVSHPSPGSAEEGGSA